MLVARVAACAVFALVFVGGAAYAGNRVLLGNDSRPRHGGTSGTASGPVGDYTATPDYAQVPASATPSASASASASSSPSASASAGKQEATTAPTTRNPTTTQPATPAGPREEVLRLVNVERAKVGCSAVTADSRLRAAADAHSADMAANDYFSHTSQDGRSFTDRLTNAGYKWSSAGENIAKGQATPAAVMSAWMNSSGHKANILNCGFRHLGVGLAYDGNTPVWTQDFATPG